jgi:hypothetical protein
MGLFLNAVCRKGAYQWLYAESYFCIMQNLVSGQASVPGENQITKAFSTIEKGNFSKK